MALLKASQQLDKSYMDQKEQRVQHMRDIHQQLSMGDKDEEVGGAIQTPEWLEMQNKVDMENQSISSYDHEKDDSLISIISI